MERSDDIYLPQSVVCSHAVGGKEDAEGSSPQSFCYVLTGFVEDHFPQTAVVGADGGNGFSFAHRQLPAVWPSSPTDNEMPPVHGLGVVDPGLGG